MDYAYNIYSGYGEDRSYQLPPLFPGGAPGGQPAPGIPGGPGSYPPFIPGVPGGGTGGQPPYFPGGVPGTAPGVPA